MKKLFSIIASVALFVSSTRFSTIIADNADFHSDSAEFKTASFNIGTELPDNSELFDDYADHVFYDGIDKVPLSSSNTCLISGMEPSMGKIAYEIRLNKYEQKVYDSILEKIKKIADGSETNTIIKGSVDFPGEAAVLKDNDKNIPAIKHLVKNCFNSYNIYSSLVADCPYLLYWYDKTEHTSCKWAGYQDGTDITLEYEFNFPVCADYSADEFTTKGQLDIVQTACANAHNVVELHKYESDYQKLLSYKEYILKEVKYNKSVSSQSNLIYGDPWQLIWVFDNNSDTNVVCEGYAKAFQYLCDLSTFKNPNIRCCSVDGIAGDAHMWNIVTMDDKKNYLVDLTNSDSGAIGQNGGLFLAGTSGDAYNGYTFKLGLSSSPTYKYYTSPNSLSGILTGNDILNLSSSSYVPDVVLSGINLSLGGNIGLNFYLTLSDEMLNDPTAYLELTLPGNKTEEIPVSSVKDKTYNVFNKTCYRFTGEVAVKEMTEEITTIFRSAKGSYILSFKDETTDYVPSVKYYADEILNDKKNYASAQPVIRALLNYGSKAQTYFNYRTSKKRYLADFDIITEIPTTEPDLSSYNCSVSGNLPKGLIYQGTSLLLKSNTIIRHYFLVESGHSINEYKFSTDKGTDKAPVQKGNNCYYFEINNISAADLKTFKETTINNTYTISYSALSYANKVLTSKNNKPLEALVTAMYYYNLAACEYIK